LSARPPLPDGPYLVVGLARSGVAAARMLAAHGEVIGVDSGRPEVPPDVPAELDSDGLAALERAAVVVKSPGVPNEAPVIARAR
jgi:UDP-N-acetylmuramoylalanine--D-glutamate ligase